MPPQDKNNAQSSSSSIRSRLKLLNPSIPDFANPRYFYSPFNLNHCTQQDWDFCDPSILSPHNTIQVSVRNFPFSARRSAKLIQTSLEHTQSKPDLNHILVMCAHRGILDLLSSSIISTYRHNLEEYDLLCATQQFDERLERVISDMLRGVSFQPTQSVKPDRISLHMPKLDSEQCTYNLIRSFKSLLDIDLFEAAIYAILNTLRHQENSYAEECGKDIEYLLNAVEIKSRVVEEVCKWVKET